MKTAVIFDMDGVVVNSEDLWAIAEKEVFSSLGVIMDDNSCNQTKSMTTEEVTKFWFSKYPWGGKGFKEVEQMVISRVIELIKIEDCEVDGIKNTVKKLKALGLKIGLATNAPFRIIPEVLAKLELTHLFDNTTSAEFEKRGKPGPDVYLTSSRGLGELGRNCIAIEDSNSGIQAAKTAGMTVIGFSNNGKNTDLSDADYIVDKFSEVDWDLLIND